MYHEKGFYKSTNPIGPGGRKCGCCFPQDPKGKKAVKRQEVKEQRKIFSKLLKEELEEVVVNSSYK